MCNKRWFSIFSIINVLLMIYTFIFKVVYNEIPLYQIVIIIAWINLGCLLFSIVKNKF